MKKTGGRKSRDTLPLTSDHEICSKIKELKRGLEMTPKYCSRSIATVDDKKNFFYWVPSLVPKSFFVILNTDGKQAGRGSDDVCN